MSPLPLSFVRHGRSLSRVGSGRILVIAVLVCLVGAAVLLMTQEQDARAAAEGVSHQLGEMLDAEEPLTPEAVHEKIGREPDITRTPAKHRFVEEYRWNGPLASYTVYAYYETAATKLLEAVSLNQKLADWEQGPR